MLLGLVRLLLARGAVISFQLCHRNFWLVLEIRPISRTSFELSFYLDYIAILFFSTVVWISAAIYLYSLDYMASDRYFFRFHRLLFIFVMSIIFLIFRGNLWFSLIGWDGLGLTSFLLVVYYGRVKSFNAGFLTLIRNRVGDACLIIALAILANQSFFLLTLKFQAPFLGFLILFVIAACTKRAQIPFSAWLPAAMAAPTPVSSLVHSSTLVTAGVYLLIRCPGFASQQRLSHVLLWLSVLTLSRAGVSALFEEDVKKIVALSTLSQLGVIVFSVTLGAYKLAFLHLISHAFFKALLFIAVGSFIHSVSDYQDLRIARLNLLEKPFTLAFTIAAKIRLCGLPFLSGFFSKDLCLEWAESGNRSVFLLFITGIGTRCTLLYTVRFFILVFGRANLRTSVKNAQENSSIMLKAIRILIFPALYARLLTKEWIRALGDFFVLPLTLKIGLLSLVLSSIFMGLATPRFCRSFQKAPKWLYGARLGLAAFRGRAGLLGSMNVRKFNQIYWDNYWNQGYFLITSKPSSRSIFSYLNERLALDTLILCGWIFLFFFWIFVY